LSGHDQRAGRRHLAKAPRREHHLPGSGAVIVNLARFGDWQRWGYDWRLDIEPTLREVADQNPCP
jgi:hypothetical protein